MKALRRDSDDGDRLAVDGGFAADDGWIGVEARIPVGVTDDEDGIGPDCAAFGRKDEATKIGLDAKKREKITADVRGPHRLALTAEAQAIYIERYGRGHAGENA